MEWMTANGAAAYLKVKPRTSRLSGAWIVRESLRRQTSDRGRDETGTGDANVSDDYSTFPLRTLYGYSRELVVTEKLQALVQLRMLNTRMKDYFDLWLVTRQPESSREVLVEAVRRTFKNRGMDLDSIGLSSAFGKYPAKQMPWSAFVKRLRFTEVPAKLSEVVEELRLFFALSLSRGEAPNSGSAIRIRV